MKFIPKLTPLFSEGQPECFKTPFTLRVFFRKRSPPLISFLKFNIISLILLASLFL